MGVGIVLDIDGVILESLVNASTAGDQRVPGITTLAAGGYAIAWVDRTTATIRGRLTDVNGNYIGPEFSINTQSAGSGYVAEQLSVTRVGSGFALSWRSTNRGGGGGSDAQARVFTRLISGTGAIGAEVQLDSGPSTDSTPFAPGLLSSTALSDGRYVVTWAMDGGRGFVVRSRILNAAGEPVGATIAVGDALSVQNSTVALPDGGFLIARATSSGIKLRRFDANGAAVGNEVAVAAGAINAMSLLTDGRVVIVYEALEAGSSTAHDIFAVTYTPGGQISGATMVNQVTSGDQTEPDVQPLSGGRFLVAWTDYSGIGDDTDGGIKSRIFGG